MKNRVKTKEVFSFVFVFFVFLLLSHVLDALWDGLVEQVALHQDLAPRRALPQRRLEDPL